jgi:hypothetical protein
MTRRGGRLDHDHPPQGPYGVKLTIAEKLKKRKEN